LLRKRKPMRILKIALFTLVIFSLNTSCFKDNDDNLIAATDINDFVYRAMKANYLYKSQIPDLADNRFASSEDYSNYLDSYTSPEELFESLIYQRETVDRFSIIREDGIALLQQLNGVITSNGLEYILYRQPGSDTDVFGVIRIVLNNSVASNLGLQRGQIFDGVDGVPLTIGNFNALLGSNSYTLNLATYNTNDTPETADDSIESTSETASLTKEIYNENPVHLTKVVEVNGEKVGYLMYNAFIAEYNDQLNNAFAELKANNVEHLVLDLRYNGGGRVDTAALLGSMVTGQFDGQLFSKLLYNEERQDDNRNYNFSSTLSSGSSVNSLDLDKVYVLTTNGTASASELVMNSLSAYIEVVQIGINTTGKTQASNLVFDSPDFGPNNINPSHNYALLPLVANSVNKNDALVPPTGLTPNIELNENPANLGILGDIEEPLFAAALEAIAASGRRLPQPINVLKPLELKTADQAVENIMYVEKEL